MSFPFLPSLTTTRDVVCVCVNVRERERERGGEGGLQRVELE